MSTTTTNSTSKVIAHASLAANAKVDMVKYTINSAYIVVNGTTYNVTIANSTVSSSVQGNGTVNGSTAIVMDVSPTVVATYNQTNPVRTCNLVHSCCKQCKCLITGKCRFKCSTKRKCKGADSSGIP